MKRQKKKELICPICKTEYNLINKMPRLFGSCGHTFCTECIIKILKKNKEKVICPIDNKKNYFFDSKNGIHNFPSNLTLENIIRKKDKTNLSNKMKNNLVNLRRLSKKINKEDIKILFCNSHQKVCDIICLKDEKIICSDCVLFGRHKNHKYKSTKMFLEDLKKKVTKKSYRIKKIDFSNNITESLKKIEKKKKKFNSKIKDFFIEINKELNLKQEDIENKLNYQFSKFDNSIEILNDKIPNMKKLNNEINIQLLSLKNMLNEKNPNQSIFLENLFEKNGLKEIQNEISNQVNDFFLLSKNLINKNLEKIQIGCYFKNFDKVFKKNLFIKNLKKKKKKKQLNNTLSSIERIDNEENFFINSQIENKILKKTKMTNYNRNNFTNSYSENTQLQIFDSKKLDQNETKNSKLYMRNNSFKTTPKNILRKNSSFGNKNINSISNKNNYFLNSNIDVGRKQSLYSNRNILKLNSLQHGNKIDNNEEDEEKNLIYSSRNHRNKSCQLKELNFNLPKIKLNYEKNINFDNPNNSSILSSNYNKTKNSNYNSSSKLHKKKNYGSKINLNLNLENIDKEEKVNKKIINWSNKKINDAKLLKYLLRLEKLNSNTLNLNHNKITTFGFGKFLSRISSYDFLEKIYLKNNLLNDESIFCLVKYGNALGNLKYINLKGNKNIHYPKKYKDIFKDLKSKGIIVEI